MRRDLINQRISLMFFFFYDTTFANLAPVEAGLAQVRAKYPQMTVGAFESLIHIARSQNRIVDEKLSVKDLANEMSIPYPTLARHTDILGNGVAGKEGLHFLEKVSGDVDQKQRRVVLTPDGAEFLYQFEIAMNSVRNVDNQGTGQ